MVAGCFVGGGGIAMELVYEKRTPVVAMQRGTQIDMEDPSRLLSSRLLPLLYPGAVSACGELTLRGVDLVLHPFDICATHKDSRDICTNPASMSSPPRFVSFLMSRIRGPAPPVSLSFCSDCDESYGLTKWA